MIKFIGGNTKTKLMMGIMLLLVVVLCCVAILIGPSAPDRPFSVEDLLLTENDLPPGWMIDDRWSRDNREGADREAAINLILPGPAPEATITIYISRYSSMKLAQRKYEELGKVYYLRDSVPISNQLTFTSTVANAARLGLKQHKDKDVITYWARYEEFLVRVNARIERQSSEPLEFEQIEEILQAVDERITRYLYPQNTPVKEE